MIISIVESHVKSQSLTQNLDIVDIKPANMEELTEVITAAEFHPIECSTFAYSSSKGTVRLCDMRQSALCDSHSKSKSIICAFCFISFASLLQSSYIMSPSYLQHSHQYTGSEIVPSWSPMRLKIQFWRPEFLSWAP